VLINGIIVAVNKEDCSARNPLCYSIYGRGHTRRS
jgi:hypothetical protein